jgi:signal transduction histidine kinase
MTLPKTEASPALRNGTLAGTAGACIPIALGALGLIGWSRDNLYLTSLRPGLVPINPLTAVCLMLAGVALVSLFRASESLKWAVPTAAILLAAIGVSCLLGYVTGWNIPLDRVLFREKLTDVPLGPNRMAPNTALNFILLASAFAFAGSRNERARRASQILSLIVAVISFLGLLGYLFHFDSLYQITDYYPMSLSAVLGFLFAAMGSLCLYPHSGPASLLFSDSTGGFMARRLMPVAIFAPTLAAWIFLAAQSSGRLDAATGMARLTFANILIASLAVYATSRRLHNGDRKRMLAEAEVRRLNASLQGQAERLAAANKGLESFSYSVSHDLRSPLTHVQGYAEMLALETAGKLDGKAARYLGVIQDETVRMGALIDDLLAFAMVEHVEMRMGQVSMEEVVRESIRRLEPEIGGRKVAWVIQSLPSVRADRSLVDQVMLNLLSNALKYSRNRTESQVEIGFGPAGSGRDVFYVRDNGVGFDMRHADRLFEVFQRMHAPSDFEGTGIGLANVRSIIERHGGKVWAEAEVDKGATFFFSLPLVPRQPNGETKAARDWGSGQGAPTQE